ncbi:PepSY-like domain-containing protein [Hymenobacter caeli]|uniref:Putative beta-lactamase-inhibitor-like PepSY-like domain-containing protein n=1 Tax=Hymenobacter caeli TaxID=2735894 RepID=A0ABX2FPN0_9BACT|nr:PepSY-like domain-containing protein [Hymenobacter caeli]NRT18365.1 hypothetical protein [Hymenobacter caeli]
MKPLLIAAAMALAAAGPARAQRLPSARVPAAARATFKARFPTVRATTWEQEGGNYEAGFKMNGRTMSAVITPAGKLLETETGVAPAQLPAAVRAALARSYRTHKINEAAAIVRADGATVYEAEVTKNGRAQDVLFNADGTLTKP